MASNVLQKARQYNADNVTWAKREQ